MKNILLIGALLLTPLSAHAVSDIDVPTMSCSGAETSDLTSFLSLSCAGNLSLAGGSLFSDSKIVLTATGSMTLDNLRMTAPNIDLNGGSVVLGSGVSFDTGNSPGIGSGLGGTFPFITPPPGSSISIIGNSYPILGSNYPISSGAGFTEYFVSPGTYVITLPPGIAVGTVPEPNMISLLPVGVITLAFLTRNRRRTRHPSC
ncbi:MAG TPA: PEP-CTERM sorting domain-containing protein [Burkholderiales bacterium]|nr:PEP-CTERM sorting domain-containing protein [Burkholderiales bacterium]